MEKSSRDILKFAEPKQGPQKRAPERGEGILVRLQPERLEALDEWRLTQADQPSRPEAMRRLYEVGLAFMKRNAPKLKGR